MGAMDGLCSEAEQGASGMRSPVLAMELTPFDALL